MTTLQVTETTDYSGIALADIDAIDFVNDGTFAQATFLGTQFGPGLVLDTVAISGSNGGNLVQVNLGPGQTQFDASGWSFSNWLFSSVAIYGTAGDDTITGSSSNDSINGGAGNDVLNGGAGDDSLISDLGNGIDTLIGGSGLDQALVNRSTSTTAFSINLAAGGGGADIGDGTRISEVEQIAAYTGAGNDRIIGGNYFDTMDSGRGNDELRGLKGTNWFHAGGGNDRLFCASDTGNSIYDGGAGIDTLSLYRTGGKTAIKINIGVDNPDIGDGSQLMANIEILYFFGSLRNDFVLGGLRADNLNGGAGNDVMNGRTGNDTLNGSAGADQLTGQYGSDILTGGIGNDRFIFAATGHSAVGAARDTITDFASGQDKIDLTVIGGLSYGGLSAFSGVAGEIIAIQGAANTIVRIDIDGNRTADMEIGFTGLITFQAGDFLV